MSKIEKCRVQYTSASITWSVKQIVASMQKGTLTFDSVIQRALVWDNVKKSQLIESVLLGRKIPAIHCIKIGAEKEAKGFDCVDGKQRCNALREFKENKLVLKGVIEELEGLTYDDLDADDKNYFDTYTGMSVTYYVDATEKEVAKIMACLNNGKSLTGIERSRICAMDMSSITALAGHDFFKKNLKEKAVLARHNEDILIKSLLLKDNITDLSGRKITNFYESKLFTKEEVAAIKGELDNIDAIYDEINARKKVAKKTLSALKNRTHLVIILDFISNIEANKKLIANFLIAFYEGKPTMSEDYNATVVSGINRPINVATRQSEIRRYWDKYLRTVEETEKAKENTSKLVNNTSKTVDNTDKKTSKKK